MSGEGVLPCAVDAQARMMGHAVIRGATILTADGLYFDYDAPDPATITLHAIARGLANTCRFGGQCERFYSVAEHSVYVSELVPPEFALAGLLHDAAEAFICDMPKPLKELLPDYKAVERRVEAAVLAKFGVTGLPLQVKRADTIMLATEQQQLMRNHDRWKWTDSYAPADLAIICWSPEEAYDVFLERAAELGLRP